MASLSIFFLKFMVAEFPVYMLKQVQQYSKYFLVPLTLLWTCTVFLTSVLCAEKLNADFFFQVYASILFHYSLGLSVLPACWKHFQIVAFFWMDGENLIGSVLIHIEYLTLVYRLFF